MNRMMKRILWGLGLLVTAIVLYEVYYVASLLMSTANTVGEILTTTPTPVVTPTLAGEPALTSPYSTEPDSVMLSATVLDTPQNDPGNWTSGIPNY
jgi:hypothetical protein